VLEHRLDLADEWDHQCLNPPQQGASALEAAACFFGISCNNSHKNNSIINNNNNNSSVNATGIGPKKIHEYLRIAKN
jgi:hypothetical protein